MNKPITIWTLKTKIITKDDRGNSIESIQWIHNHIEDGHCHNDKPTVRFDSQNGWKGGTWKKEFTELDGNYKIIKGI